MGEPKEKVVKGPRALPIVGCGGTIYFVDLRLREFRDIKDFSNSVRFGSEKGQQICKETGVVSCPSCGMSTIVSQAFENEALRCMQCFNRIEPS
ncbi:hypothetical protein ACFL3G_03960 [Planctomycetota bacterium]